MNDPAEHIDPIKAAILSEIDSQADDITALARKLYENPETAYQERNACRWLSERLGACGFEVQNAPGGIETAFTARVAGAAPRQPCIALLAEYDALPKIGHGCGHNLIAAASLAAAIALSRAWPEVAGSILVVGTPAEEGGGGKALLADAGVFESVRMAMMFHPAQFNRLGTDSLGRIKAKVEFFGQSSHAAASPEKGFNALDAMVGAYNHISALRQQLSSDARIHGIITHGGESPNVIPDYSAGLFYIRAIRRGYLGQLFKKFEACCQGAALAAGCRCEITVEPPSLEPMKRNRCLEGVWRRNMELLGLVPDFGPTGIGSTDLGNISQLMPVIQPYLAICPPETAFHTLEFARATQSEQGSAAVLAAAKLLALTACDYLASEKIRAAVDREFNQE